MHIADDVKPTPAQMNEVAGAVRETLDAKYELLKTNLEDLEGGETHREGEEDETATLSGRTVRGSDEMLRSIGKRQFQPISRRSDPHF
ncbi:hypothetical protein JCM3766R1_001116 [Sporobolomyces carnicolor]